jgi:hypothetical protein
VSRKPKGQAPVELKRPAEVTAASGQPVAPHNSPTTSLVVEALRQNGTDAGPAYARAELIAALAGCALYSIELDGVAATLALLADAAYVVEQGFGKTVPSPGLRLH